MSPGVVVQETAAASAKPDLRVIVKVVPGRLVARARHIIAAKVGNAANILRLSALAADTQARREARDHILLHERSK